MTVAGAVPEFHRTSLATSVARADPGKIPEAYELSAIAPA
jgi:hypothetical protein